MKNLLATTLTAALFAASSFAFAADNNGGNMDNGMMDNDKTGSIETRDPTEPPDQKTIEFCKTAPADDANCQNMQSR